MRAFKLTITLVLGCAIGPVLLAEEPIFDSIKYTRPSQYLEIAESLGDQDAISEQAAKLNSTDDRKTLANILRWMETDLRCDAEHAYQWRNYDDVLKQQCCGGCADQAIVCQAYAFSFRIDKTASGTKMISGSHAASAAGSNNR